MSKDIKVQGCASRVIMPFGPSRISRLGDSILLSNAHGMDLCGFAPFVPINEFRPLIKNGGRGLVEIRARISPATPPPGGVG